MELSIDGCGRIPDEEQIRRIDEPEVFSPQVP
jgi:hypothetical protein